MMSDESENDGAYIENNFENDIYYKKYKLLLERCEALQKQNERLVYRIQQVKKIAKRRFGQVHFMKELLLKDHGEDWKVIPKIEIKVEEEEKPSTSWLGIKIKEEKLEDYEEKPEKVKPVKKATKRKSTKAERDPNAPKRPSNPFFQFCQEQRQILLEQLSSELKPGEPEPSKQEVTRQLAIKWKSLSGLDKKIYIDMYERSKEKYVVELSEYNMKK